jgi:hypothetical protein
MAEDDKYVPSKGNSGLNPASGESAFVRDSKGLLTRKTDSGWLAGDGIEAAEGRNKAMGSSAFVRNSNGMLTRKSEVEENNKTLANMRESAFERNRLGLLTEKNPFNKKDPVAYSNNNPAVASIRTHEDFFKKSKNPQNVRRARSSFKGGLPYGGYASKFNFKSNLHSMMSGGGVFSLPDLSQFCPIAGKIGAAGGFRFSGGHIKPSLLNDVAFPSPVDADD